MTISNSLPVVQYCEEDGSPEERLDSSSGFSATRVLRCAWEDRYNLVWMFMGSTYSDWGFGAYAYCQAYDINPAKGQNQGEGTEGAYIDALVTLTFSSGADVNDSGDMYSEELRPTTEFLTIDPTSYKWDSYSEGTSVTAEEAPGRQLVGLEYVRTTYHRPDIDPDVLNLIGCVNNSAISCTSPGLTGLSFAEETLLYKPPVLSRTVKENGTYTWKQECSFLYKPNWDYSGEAPVAKGWNYFWRPMTCKYAAMYAADGQVKPYPSADFTTISG